MQDILLVGHRQAFAWIDLWYGMYYESLISAMFIIYRPVYTSNFIATLVQLTVIFTWKIPWKMLLCLIPLGKTNVNFEHESKSGNRGWPPATQETSPKQGKIFYPIVVEKWHYKPCFTGIGLPWTLLFYKYLCSSCFARSRAYIHFIIKIFFRNEFWRCERIRKRNAAKDKW